MPIRREQLRHSSAQGRRARPLLAWVLLSVAGSAAGLAPGAHVADFTLKDETGAAHELYGLSAKRAVVIMTQSNGCPIVRLAVPALREIRDRYPKQDVEFLLLNPTLQDSAESVAREVAEFNFGLRVMLDPRQKVGEALGVDRTAEVYVIDPKSWTLVYHGPIDDRLNYESQRPVHHRYLSDALDAMLAGKPVAVASASSPGCLINFPNRNHG
ncbi:MAG TPA: redoxin domain-containing protein [Steroidobacteraceae bacterium]|nr:redoxin domain-containing protein [Steroidobacteraceae bacterium]